MGRKVLFALFCALVLTACATTRKEPFDPGKFLAGMEMTGEGTCRLSDGKRFSMLPCRSYQAEENGSIYIALYHPKYKMLLAIREIRTDGTETLVWARPQAQKAKGPTT